LTKRRYGHANNILQSCGFLWKGKYFLALWRYAPHLAKAAGLLCLAKYLFNFPCPGPPEFNSHLSIPVNIYFIYEYQKK